MLWSILLKELPTAVLLAIGDELLNGDVQDTNIFWLSQRLTRMGLHVAEARIIRDRPAAIAEAFQALLARSPEVLLTSGGLGPTEDDRTLAALAEALTIPLIDNAEARRLVEVQYERLLAEHYIRHRASEPVRRKMARLPEGAVPLSNPLGTAPAVSLRHERTQIYCLPGVPGELRAIFQAHLVRDFRERFDLGAWVELELVVACQDEAAVAAPLREVTPRHPHVYLKSLARAFPEAREGALHIIAAVQAEDEKLARQQAEAALYDLAETLEASGLTVRSASFDMDKLHNHQKESTREH
jgi:molybdenum cofactor synthesis domain-containing protein